MGQGMALTQWQGMAPAAGLCRQATSMFGRKASRAGAHARPTAPPKLGLLPLIYSALQVRWINIQGLSWEVVSQLARR